MKTTKPREHPGLLKARGSSSHPAQLSLLLSTGDVANNSKERTQRSTMPRSFSAPYASSQDQSAEPLPACFTPDPFLYPSPLHAVALQSPFFQSPLYEDPAFSAASRALPTGMTSSSTRRRLRRASGWRATSHAFSAAAASWLEAASPGRALARNRQPRSSLCKRPSELLPLQAERRHPPAMERGSSTPSPCGHEGGTAVTTTRVWSSWDAAAERTLAAKTVVEDFHPPPSSLRKPPKLQALAQGRPPSIDHYDTDGSSRGSGQEPVSYESEEGGCLMVKAQERPRVAAPAKKCRFTDEGSEGAGRKGGGRKSSPKSKKAARSQSENSLLNRSRMKYGTVDREESAQKPSRQRRLQGNADSGYRKWSSTAEISQEELSPGSTMELARGQQGPGPAGYTYPGSDSECSGEPARRAPVCRLEDGLVGGDSESSLSDGDSPPPYSSGASSDTDESGGLVWPQQLSPQLVSASGPGKATSGQPKVFVKIKASHALKKKIMRFRSGSLKVMTTV
ncbi:Dapper-like 3, partial [Ophiophagus hannah]